MISKSLFLPAALVLCGLLAGGCSSLPNSASFASVVIKDRTVEQIRDATVAVFTAEGYAGSAAAGGQLVFTKEGSRLNTISRDGLYATQQGASTLVRVKVKLVNLAPDTHRLQCDAFMVSGAGDSFFEEEHRLANFRSRPYQNLLDKVARQLK
jgi:hypothetical protein